jgi:hypothetical protein
MSDTTGTGDGGLPVYKDIDTAPLGVKLLSAVVVVGAILDLSLATLMFLNRNSDNMLAETGWSSGTLAAYSIVLGILGLVAFAIGIGLRAGNNWARLLTVALAVVRLIGLGIVMIEHDNRQWYSALVPAVIYAVVAFYLLYDDEAKAYYGVE